MVVRKTGFADQIDRNVVAITGLDDPDGFPESVRFTDGFRFSIGPGFYWPMLLRIRSNR